MIGVSESLIRHTRHASDHHVPLGHFQPRGGGGHAHAASTGSDLSDPASKLQLIDTMLSSSPPLPAPPAMQQAQIQAQEKELERQLIAMQQANAASASHAMAQPKAHRPSISAGVKPLVLTSRQPTNAVAAAPAPVTSALAQQLKPRLAQTAGQPAAPPVTSSAAASAAAAAAAANSDLFAKVEVQPRQKAPAAGALSSSFMPSSLSAALTDSGLLYRTQQHERHAAVRPHGQQQSQRDDFSSRRGGDNSSSSGLTLTIFLHPYSDVPVRPCRILLQLPSDAAAAAASSSSAAAASLSNPTTDEVISELLRKWSSGELKSMHGLRAPLAAAANDKSWWLLHMVDEDTVESGDDSDADGDDSDDESAAIARASKRMSPGKERGMPEEDLPALERGKPIKSFGATTLAMVLARGRKHPMPAPAAQASSAEAVTPTAATAATPAAATTPVRPPRPTTSITRNAIGAATAAQPSPRAAPSPSNKRVSMFSGGGAGTNLLSPSTPTSAAAAAAAASGGSSAAASAAAARSSSQQAFSSDPSRHSVFIAPGSEGSGPNGAGGGPAMLGEKFYLRIHIGDHESHILGLYKSQLLSEVLPVLSKKKQSTVALKSEVYRFVYLDNQLQRDRGEQLRDMTRIRIGELASDELLLIPRLGGGGDLMPRGSGVGGGMLSPERAAQPSSTLASDEFSSGVAPLASTSDAPSLSSFQFSLDTAGSYCQWRVIKTNQRGKRQPRIFGMDRHRIYNKTQSGADEEGVGAGMFSFLSRKMSSTGDAAGGGVSRAYRDINTIASVHVVSLRPTCFCIAFKDTAAKDGKIAQTREYELETKMECAEIVAKLRFLMAHAVSVPPPPPASLASSSLLSQSIR